MIPVPPAAGNQFGVHKHVELTTDARRCISRQPVEIVHHMHLIVITESMSDVCPLRKGRRRFPVEGRLEADNPGVQLGWDSDLIAKAPLKLADPQPCAVCKIGHAGGMVFFPAETWVGMKNIGKDNISLVFIFSAPGFEDNMRCGSVLAGQPAPPITTDELKACAHKGHVEFEAFTPAAQN